MSRLLTTALLLLAAYSGLCAKDRAASLLDYAAQLTRQGHTFRAITEIKRYRHFYPSGALQQRADYLEAWALYRGGHYHRALRICSAASENGGKQRFTYLAGLCYYRLGRYREAMRRFDRLERSNRSFRLALLSLTCAFQYGGDAPFIKSRLQYIRQQYPTQTARAGFQAFADILLDPPEQHSPDLAVLGALLLPGFGHLYNGDPATGVYAFATNGVLLGLAVGATVLGFLPYAVLAGYLFLGSYTTNLAMAGYTTGHYNQRVLDQYEQKVTQECFKRIRESY